MLDRPMTNLLRRNQSRTASIEFEDFVSAAGLLNMLSRLSRLLIAAASGTGVRPARPSVGMGDIFRASITNVGKGDSLEVALAPPNSG